MSVRESQSTLAHIDAAWQPFPMHVSSPVWSGASLVLPLALGDGTYVPVLATVESVDVVSPLSVARVRPRVPLPFDLRWGLGPAEQPEIGEGQWLVWAGPAGLRVTDHAPAGQQRPMDIPVLWVPSFVHLPVAVRQHINPGSDRAQLEAYQQLLLEQQPALDAYCRHLEEGERRATLKKLYGPQIAGLPAILAAEVAAIAAVRNLATQPANSLSDQAEWAVVSLVDYLISQQVLPNPFG